MSLVMEPLHLLVWLLYGIKRLALQPVKDETWSFYMTQSVPHGKHFPSRLYGTSLLMLYKVKVHTEHTNCM
jgi:hypothetical protein